MNPILIEEKLKAFLKEDIQFGDLSSMIFTEETGAMTILAKDSGIFCGAEIIERGFNILSETSVELHVKDGEMITHGQTLAVIHGRIRDLLQAERTVLNLIQRMSGIATMTNRYVEAAGGRCQIADTRKTTPGLGMFEKYAVVTGGGSNHRRSLNDGIMLKDNHIAYAGSITEAVQRAAPYKGHMDKIEVEIETPDMLEEAITAGADIIMFDNCSPEMIKENISKVPDHITTEASGGITFEKIDVYSRTGVDYISVGALFYSAHALDISAEVAYV